MRALTGENFVGGGVVTSGIVFLRPAVALETADEFNTSKDTALYFLLAARSATTLLLAQVSKWSDPRQHF